MVNKIVKVAATLLVSACLLFVCTSSDWLAFIIEGVQGTRTICCCDECSHCAPDIPTPPASGNDYDAVVDPSGKQVLKTKKYEKYVSLQRSKILSNSKVSSFDKRIEGEILSRYAQREFSDPIGIGSAEGMTPSILCVGARLGGEVRAFKHLGLLAIGIDVEPGRRSEHVLVGDAHDMRFPDNSFDLIYINVLDHIKYIDVFISESRRVLKTGGRFILDMDGFAPDKYAVNDLRKFWKKSPTRVSLTPLLGNIYQQVGCKLIFSKYIPDKKTGIANFVFEC